VRNKTRNHGLEGLRRARDLRRNMSASEQVLWNCIRKRQLGHEFKRQVPVGPYVLDFYCPAASLCVEVDGEHHALRVAADAARDAWLKRRGVETIRLPSLDLFEQSTATNRWLNLIQASCERRRELLHPQPPPQLAALPKEGTLDQPPPQLAALPKEGTPDRPPPHLAPLHEEGARDV